MNAEELTLHLQLETSLNPMAIPRCLQVLSRRNFTLEELTSYRNGSGGVQLNMRIHGPTHWHAKLPGLLEKLPDVRSIQVVRSEA